MCRWLTDVLTMYAGDTVPADEEAVRFVLTFASSLSDPGLGVAPSIAAMPSLTTLVPHYDVSLGYSVCCLCLFGGRAACVEIPGAGAGVECCRLVFGTQHAHPATAVLPIRPLPYRPSAHALLNCNRRTCCMR